MSLQVKNVWSSLRRWAVLAGLSVACLGGPVTIVGSLQSVTTRRYAIPQRGFALASVPVYAEDPRPILLRGRPVGLGVCPVLEGQRSVAVGESIVDVVDVGIQMGSCVPQVSVTVTNVSVLVAALRGGQDVFEIAVPIGVRRVTSVGQGVSRVGDAVTLERSSVAPVLVRFSRGHQLSSSDMRATTLPPKPDPLAGTG